MSHVDAERARWEALIDREVIGEPLDSREREFVARYEAAHPELAHERAIFEAAIESLREQLDEEDELSLARDAARALERHRRDRQRAERDRSRRSRWVLGVLATAAGFALWFGLRADSVGDGFSSRPEQVTGSEQPGSTEIDVRPSVVTPVDPIARLSMVSAGEALELGETLELGASRSSARACVSWTEPTAVVCFEGSLRSLPGELGERRLRLESGRAVAALEPLEPGQHFTIETAAGSASAIGTVFTVELDEDRTWVTVLEGRVELRDPEVRVLEAGQRSALPGEAVTFEGAPLVDLVDLAEQLRADPHATAQSDPPAAAEIGKPSDASKPRSAKQLATAAQRERAAKNYEETARLYRELLRRYPDSPEAANVPVRLGDVLTSIGDHQGALEAYELYLERGGKALAPEAEYGRIRALRALKRKADERAAIEAFLTARPDDYRVAELQDRLREL